MAPITTSSDESNHQALMDKLDIYALPKPFRNPTWRPPQRRNKNLKQILSEAQRREASSMLASQTASGSSTPAHADAAHNGGGSGSGTNIAQAAQRLDRLVLERNTATQAKAETSTTANNNNGMLGAGTGVGIGMSVTYSNIESAPSLHPSSQKKYCDITGLPTSYTDPKSRMRYYNKEVYNYIRTMPQGMTEGYLGARGAHTVLK